MKDAEKNVVEIQTKIQQEGHTDSLISQEKNAQKGMEGALKI